MKTYKLSFVFNSHAICSREIEAKSETEAKEKLRKLCNGKVTSIKVKQIT